MNRVGLLLVMFVAGALAQSYPTFNITGTSCKFTYTDPASGTQYYYDMSSLKLPYGQDYRGFDSTAFYQFYVNVCNSVNCNAPTAGACQMNYVNGAWQPHHDLGDYRAATWSLIPHFNHDPTRGLQFQLSPGDTCIPGKRSTRINLNCDTTADDPVDANMTVAMKGCNYDFTIVSAAACPTIITPPGPNDNGGGGSSLSGGSVFLIIFFVFSFVYVAGGCIYRRVSYGVHGMEACPNHEFWTALPGLVQDGFRYCINLCRGSSSGGNLQYETVK